MLAEEASESNRITRTYTLTRTRRERSPLVFFHYRKWLRNSDAEMIPRFRKTRQPAPLLRGCDFIHVWEIQGPGILCTLGEQITSTFASTGDAMHDFTCSSLRRTDPIIHLKCGSFPQTRDEAVIFSRFLKAYIHFETLRCQKICRIFSSFPGRSGKTLHLCKPPTHPAALRRNFRPFLSLRFRKAFRETFESGLERFFKRSLKKLKFRQGSSCHENKSAPDLSQIALFEYFVITVACPHSGN